MYARAYIYIIIDGESRVFWGSGEEDKADCIGGRTEKRAIGTAHVESLKARKIVIKDTKDRHHGREALLLGRWDGVRKKARFSVIR